tara:strand:+ start:172 stop:363 length:192 start_codon:yes stop_codon:yes gene_type:complete
MASVDGGLVDYAYPMMMAQSRIKSAHDAVLNKDFTTAIEDTMTAMAELKLMLNALKEMRELYR